ncbi:acetyl-CoA carboxylase biotin carboxyl carrier protein [Shewanella sp. SW36]|uniref:acetyl-CoA carboxylase biotin carboxyl carrier protein n=1 Tax=unclassified Shewanella TaxID=196818 RepID=UPI0021DA21E2|nr:MULTISPECIES: acetyl-CoA carboxylase biotin carboxyl carrier protein [unclassified Shewanella]MCU7974545.1 acetyl-CoA carboxylase biotin carboxyl carrier protein [Shewanella sp. SW36]MCU7989933.1 acetyl-CoA carboxylase biotin carboxyl carrier protein [Shewanella sp. SW1]MCU8051330.1 acetyl-CoA carboxylase biotin carboxyl carrier protein [Shewanella sp. SM43]
MAMDLRKIKKLIELVQESDIAELAITEGEESIRITRYSPMPANMQSQQAIPRARVESLSEQAKQTGISPSTEGFVQVSPMVGTFYAAAELDEVPLVKVGQRVSQGEVICIIEAMRMMNPIQAERDGVFSAIWAKDGDEVAFDQPLFTLI